MMAGGKSSALGGAGKPLLPRPDEAGAAGARKPAALVPRADASSRSDASAGSGMCLSGSGEMGSAHDGRQAPYATPQYTGCRYDVAKPPYSYASLIAQALLATPDRKLTLSQIYAWIMDKYPYYHSENSGWQNSIRHNLSLNSCFVKLAKSERDPAQPGSGKGSYWTINEAELGLLNNGTFKRRKLVGVDGVSKSRRKRRSSSATSFSSAASLPSAESLGAGFHVGADVPEYYGAFPLSYAFSAQPAHVFGAGAMSGVMAAPIVPAPHASFAHAAMAPAVGGRKTGLAMVRPPSIVYEQSRRADAEPMVLSIADWDADAPADMDVIESVLGRPTAPCAPGAHRPAANPNAATGLAAALAVPASPGAPGGGHAGGVFGSLGVSPAAGRVAAPMSGAALWELQRSAAEVRTDMTDPLEYLG